MRVSIRRGSADDIPTVLGILDRAAEWLVAQGRTGQWGAGRQSTNPHRLAQAETWPSLDMFIALVADEPAGAMVVADSPSKPILKADEPERYVRLLLSDPRFAGQGVGARLLDQARALARQAGVSLLRLDCYAGGDGKLVRYYERQGFTVVRRFEGIGADGNPWSGALLEQRL